MNHCAPSLFRRILSDVTLWSFFTASPKRIIEYWKFP